MNGRIFYLYNPFTRNRANSVIKCSTVCRSKACTVLRIPFVNETQIIASFCPVEKRSKNLCKSPLETSLVFRIGVFVKPREYSLDSVDC